MENPDVQKNIQAILEHEKMDEDRLTFAERAANKASKIASKPSFAIFHMVWFASWIVLNTTLFSFDPFPFTFLTLLVSLEATFLTITILINQTFTAATDNRRNSLDLQINLLNERETTSILRHVQKIGVHIGAIELTEDERHLIDDIDASELIAEITEAQSQNEK